MPCAGYAGVCNPYCGLCKPPKPRPRICPKCRTANFRPQDTNCKKCGEGLPAFIPPPVVLCNFCGLTCANPCGKSKQAVPDGGFQLCHLRTIPKT